MAHVEPATFGGHRKKVSADTSQRGGLEGLIFSSRCPPDVQPNSRIIALCGITDFAGDIPSPLSSDTEASSSQPTKKKTGMTLLRKGKDLLSSSSRKERRKQKEALKNPKEGEASPHSDGWLLSDFYLFHHLFRGLGANQLWMTSERPSDLVEKYGVYGHGEAQGDHRVVLDATLLPDITKAGNIRVFPRAQLLEDFLRTFKAECTMAAALKQPVLLMIFGHGDPITYGVAVGGADLPRDAPRLRIRQILACLRGIDVSLTMMLTSCYSGGWVLQPELNITALTAAGADKVSEAWPSSISGRAHGSIFATAVRQAFTKMEDERATQIHPNPSGVDHDSESSTYAELTNVIHTTLLHNVDRHGRNHDIQFAAQDDEWEFEWRKRSGVPLAQFQARWNQLPILAAQQGAGRGPSKTGGLDMGSLSLSEGDGLTEVQNSYGLHRKLNKGQSISAITDMAVSYLNSLPGSPNAADNKSCHGDSTKLVQGERKDIPTYRLNMLQAALHYRMAVIKLASEYKDLLGLSFPDCDAFEVESWQYAAGTEDRTSPKEPDTKYKKFQQYLALIAKGTIFDMPASSAGWYYRKPQEYLAIACVESGFGVDDVNKAIQTILVVKTAQVEALTLRIRKDRTVRRVGSKVFTTLGKRLRSASPPRRRAPLPSFSEVIAQ